MFCAFVCKDTENNEMSLKQWIVRIMNRTKHFNTKGVIKKYLFNEMNFYT